MMEMNTLSVVLVVAGFVLIYGAVKDRNPISVVQTVLSGGQPQDARPFAG